MTPTSDLPDIGRVQPTTPLDPAALARVQEFVANWSAIVAKAEKHDQLVKELEETKERNAGLWKRAGEAENRVNALVHEKLDLQQERNNWEETAAQHLRNIEYYRGLLLEAAKHLGDEVYVCDDGSRSADPLVAKVPELVERMKKKVASLEFNDGKADLQIQLLSLETANKLLLNEVETLRRENETLARHVPPTPPEGEPPVLATLSLRRVGNNAADPMSPPPGFSALALVLDCRGNGLNVRSPYFPAQLINPVSSLRSVLLHAGHALATKLGWDPEPLEEFVGPYTPPEDEPTIPVADLKPEDLVVEGSLSLDPGAFRKFVGQQWCQTTEWSLKHVLIYHGDHSYLVLCNVYSDLNSAGLTYEPVAVSDLPKIP